ncbi:hypothetical protein THF1C08_320127 [Vibrio jasicida]|uniref:Transposase n=1 Tax=Vibrio jasicida TaxID=766224 RepID=A0AAU9QQA6_9VIBR|nr:hypothetical protein THF1C08_320127 [Vibrio jasicida]CAH1597623.1 hypothetical protein THF1A12_320129 [Vibrio jasicida]
MKPHNTTYNTNKRLSFVLRGFDLSYTTDYHNLVGLAEWLNQTIINRFQSRVGSVSIS